MISGLIDELNKSADEWNASNMFELARMCREAADTIWQLRDDLQRANAENAKLREWCNDFWKWADPPFALKSGTFDEYMTLVERAVELGVEVDA